MSTNPLFNEAVFHELVSDLGRDDVIEVLMAFLVDTSEKIDALAADCSDRPATRREAHAIKCSAATFGFAELSGLARELELGSEKMSAAQLRQSIAALHRSLQATSEWAEANLLGTGGPVLM
jgi:HPt (histidine-containing phosphotransfer) domain-containing protein